MSVSQTTIPVDDDTRDRLRSLKSDDQTWSELLNAMADQFEGVESGDVSRSEFQALERRVSDIENMATRR